MKINVLVASLMLLFGTLVAINAQEPVKAVKAAEHKECTVVAVCYKKAEGAICAKAEGKTCTCKKECAEKCAKAEGKACTCEKECAKKCAKDAEKK